jgi:hypothetical protein
VADLKALRSSLAGMCDDLIASTGPPFESTAEVQRQVLTIRAILRRGIDGHLQDLRPDRGAQREHQFCFSGGRCGMNALGAHLLLA